MSTPKKIYGASGNDTLNGGGGAEEIYGFAGDDQLNGGLGNDVLFGGEGADTYLIGKNQGKDVVENYDSDGSLDTVHFTDMLPTDITRAIRDATTGDLTLVYGSSQVKISNYFLGASRQIDQFVFSDGSVWQVNDKALAERLAVVKGTAGDDRIQGVFDWADTIDGMAGNDQISGGRDPDTLLGGAGKDLIIGGEGNDNLQGGTGDDELSGEQGDDALAGDAGADLLVGGEGHDSLSGGQGNDKLYGSNGNDTLTGGTGDDYLDGGIDNDTLIGGAGKDTLLGGEGNDTYYITDLQDTIYETSGNDTIYVSIDDYKVPDGIENVVLAKNVRPLPYFIDGLLSGGKQYGIGQMQTLSYSFVSAAQPDLKGLTPYTVAQQSAVRDALAKYSAIAGLIFVEKNDSSDVQMRFYRDDLSAAGLQDYAGYGSYPPDSDVHINLKTQDMSLSSGKVNGNFATLLHEIGHTLGLKHLFEKPILSGSEDSTDNTVMSYQFGKQFAVDLGVFDKASVHYLFGVNHSARAGNNSYATTEHYIWDGAGTDTINASMQIQPVVIDLKPGSWNYVGIKAASILAKNQFFIGYGTYIENVTSGAGDDTLIGNERANTLTGGKGNDVLSGNSGSDKLIGGEGRDILMGGIGKDSYNLTEVKAAQDVVRIALGDSTVAQFDKAIGFKLAGHGNSLASLDKLDLPTTHIAADVAKVNGSNVGVIGSHHISHGLITFDDNDQYAVALTITKSNFANVVRYVQANIHIDNNTVAFNALGNSYVFQDGTIDTLVELTGVTTSGLSTTGLLTGGVWIS